jgi:hypothetical protein
VLYGCYGCKVRCCSCKLFRTMHTATGDQLCAATITRQQTGPKPNPNTTQTRSVNHMLPHRLHGVLVALLLSSMHLLCAGQCTSDSVHTLTQCRKLPRLLWLMRAGQIRHAQNHVTLHRVLDIDAVAQLWSCTCHTLSIHRQLRRILSIRSGSRIQSY